MPIEGPLNAYFTMALLSLGTLSLVLKSNIYTGASAWQFLQQQAPLSITQRYSLGDSVDDDVTDFRFCSCHSPALGVFYS